MSDDKKQPEKPKDNLTRIPVKQLYFPPSEHMDLPGSNAQVSNIKCYRTPENAPRWFLADFIPAHQAVELRYYEQGELKQRRKIPVKSLFFWEEE